MSADFQRIVEATLTNYQKGATDEILENSILGKKLQSKGRVKTGFSGKNFEWSVRKKQHSLTVINDGAAVTVSRKNLHTHASLEWVGYEANDMITEFEKLKNQGSEARFKLVGEVLDNLKADMKDLWNQELYKNSQATGNAGRIAGLEEMVQDNTADSNYIIGRYGYFVTNGNDDTNYLDSKTYAGLNLDSDNLDPYFWSPVLINTQATAGQPIITTFATNPLQCLDVAMTQLRDNSEGGDWPDMAIFDPGSENIIRDALLDKTSVYARQGSSDYSETDIGFRAIKFNGVDVYADVDAAAGLSTAAPVGYVFGSKHLTYRVLGKNFINLFDQADIDTLSEKYKVAHFGQLFIDSPRHMCKVFDYNVT